MGKQDSKQTAVEINELDNITFLKCGGTNGMLGTRFRITGQSGKK